MVYNSGKVDMQALSIRLPQEIYEWLKEKAERENRSLNGQVNHLLRQLKGQEERDGLSQKRSGND